MFKTLSNLRSTIAAHAAAVLATTVPMEVTAHGGDAVAGGAISGPDVRKPRHHPFLHPTKGWRDFSAPAGTNRRRKLNRQGALNVPGSHAHNLKLREWFYGYRLGRARAEHAK